MKLIEYFLSIIIRFTKLIVLQWIDLLNIKEQNSRHFDSNLGVWKISVWQSSGCSVNRRSVVEVVYQDLKNLGNWNCEKATKIAKKDSNWTSNVQFSKFIETSNVKKILSSNFQKSKTKNATAFKIKAGCLKIKFARLLNVISNFCWSLSGAWPVSYTHLTLPTKRIV